MDTPIFTRRTSKGQMEEYPARLTPYENRPASLIIRGPEHEDESNLCDPSGRSHRNREVHPFVLDRDQKQFTVVVIATETGVVFRDLLYSREWSMQALTGNISPVQASVPFELGVQPHLFQVPLAAFRITVADKEKIAA